MNSEEERLQLVSTARILHDAGYSPGTSGNISVRIGDDIIVSPTGTRLGSLNADNLSMVDLNGDYISGSKPTKESVMHAAVYRARPLDRVVIHLHSPFATALSCLKGLNSNDALLPLTPYYIMRVGRLPIVPYFAPGEKSLAAAIEHAAHDSHAILLANHGTLVSAPTFEDACAATEEIEATARLFFTIGERATNTLTARQVIELLAKFQ
ncbi:aldolase [Cryobacterium suzukii]|nr:aldolase [Cryobacterium suzukii]